MQIEFHCDSCGRLVRAPHDSAGKRGQCPYCQKSVYIPTPEEELEELPLAPDDNADRARQEALQAERRRLDRILAQQQDTGEADSSSGASNKARESREATGRTAPSGASVDDVVLAYLNAMRTSDLGRAEHFLSLLQRRRADALAVVERLASDQLPPAGLAGVPPAVYQGFLKSLRSQL